MTLELEMLEACTEHLAGTGWTPGTAYEPEADAELMEEDRQAATKREEKEKEESCGSFNCENPVLGAPHRLRSRGGGGCVDSQRWMV